MTAVSFNLDECINPTVEGFFIEKDLSSCLKLSIREDVGFFRVNNNTSPKYLVNCYSTMTLPAIRDMEVYEDDIWVSTYPKAGTTWVQNIVRLIKAAARPDTPPEPQGQLFPLEMHPRFGVPPRAKVAIMEKAARPRTVKTHLPYEFLPTQISRGKVIHCLRNPKDLVCSSFFFYRSHPTFQLATDNIHDFVDLFICGKVMLSPFDEYCRSFYRHRGDSHLFITTFEQMKRDHKGSVEKMAQFMGEDLTNEQIEEVVTKTTFNFMKESGNHPKLQFKSGFQFMRKGEVGDYVNHLNAEDIAKLDKYIAEKMSDMAHLWTE